MNNKRDYDPSYFDSNNSNSNDSFGQRKRKRKSRFSDEQEKVFIPGLPTIIPSTLNKQQEEIYILQLQIETLTRRLLTGDLGIPENPDERSPSPEPVYNTEGKRLNTREYRTRKKLEDDRHSLVLKMMELNPTYKPPGDYKPPQTKINEKVLIPQEEYPDINFVGLIIGPRGNTLKGMERDTGAKIIIRGKGSVKEGKLARKDGQPLPGEDEPLHAFVTGPTQESVMKAVQKINEVIKKGIELPENMNELRRSQLRELALLNGTLRENDGPRCSNCGANNHRSWQCPDKPNITNNVFCTNCNGVGHLAKDCKEKRVENNVNQAKIDEEYLSLMAELGEAPPVSAAVTTSVSSTPIPSSQRTATSILGGPSTSTADTNSWANGSGIPPPPPPPIVTPTTVASVTTTSANGSSMWPNAAAYYGSYDPYNAAAYGAHMWDPSAWTAAAASTSNTTDGQSSTSTNSTTTTVAGYGTYDQNQWSQYAQWYAASMGNATTTTSSGLPPPPPLAPSISAVGSIYPPPPPPSHS
ncbi:Splicing factor 1 [Dermatophagoides pteronyssinus]|uniref:Splicing factor 1 n=2 Tax=Dermatophagoides pteronyssinus TaxID=6956 RepID=A0ABQ8J795_DERPT|nr:splicing factor 1-like [Dermatophagoides pteronyssinus]KAH9418462.1 Splicing factor 1 [Dermatophagoides pteronyssinus]